MPNPSAEWIRRTGLGEVPPWAERELGALPIARIPRGTVLFRPGQPATAFVMVLAERIDVFLTGPTGREILLYSVEPGQSCIQTTLGLLGGEDYAGEAMTAEEAEIVPIPRGLFLRLMEEAPAFRAFVFRAFGTRMQDMLRLLERVAFQRVESRLAAELLALSQGGAVHATQAELANRVGTAREVVSRRLDGFARQGWVATERGQVRLRDPEALRRLAATEGAA
jgi:CRP/FNR family transcriptional regulator, anaerobic regulatory protein